MIELILSNLLEAQVSKTVSVFVPSAAPTDLPYIEVALSMFGAAIV
jgi:hypothetical protein